MITDYKGKEMQSINPKTSLESGPYQRDIIYENSPESYEIFHAFLELKSNNDIDSIQDILQNQILTYFKQEGQICYSFMEEHKIFLCLLELMQTYDFMKEQIFFLIDTIISRNPHLINLFLGETDLFLIIRTEFNSFIEIVDIEEINLGVIDICVNIIYNLCKSKQQLLYLNKIGYFKLLSSVLHKSVVVLKGNHVRDIHLFVSLKILLLSSDENELEVRIQEMLFMCQYFFDLAFQEEIVQDNPIMLLIAKTCEVLSDFIEKDDKYVLVYHSMKFYDFLIQYLNTILQQQLIPPIQLTEIILQTLNISSDEEQEINKVAEQEINKVAEQEIESKEGKGINQVINEQEIESHEDKDINEGEIESNKDIEINESINEQDMMDEKEFQEKKNEIIYDILNKIDIGLIFQYVYALLTNKVEIRFNENTIGYLIDIIQQAISIKAEFPFTLIQLSELYDVIQENGLMELKKSYNFLLLGIFQVLNPEMLHEILCMRFLHPFFAYLSDANFESDQLIEFIIESISSILKQISLTDPSLLDPSYHYDKSDELLCNKYTLISQLLPAVVFQLGNYFSELENFALFIEKSYYPSFPKDQIQNIINDSF